jgi:hypothetical protein
MNPAKQSIRHFVSKIMSDTNNPSAFRIFKALRRRESFESALENLLRKKVKVKLSHYWPWAGPWGSRRLRLPGFLAIGT